MASNSKDPPEVVTIPDEEEGKEQDWPETGPINPAEAKRYVDMITEVFDGLSELLHDDQKKRFAKDD